ncbi:2,4-diaminopentanoate dehydrogenase [Candidatus Xianfuyuplasma coldseepsis]|uniref:NADP-binding protein n=1 Tax=Candidatus Xianfuyuplasma coldseepsis TaxID=2782163 RepID=A0A7L7KQR3_9MOLU|nr:2,4-diaminopentanoate dehydrogenase [Xianfuyuplasma coldseepsis]QMS85160.1 NADP-binding protein [Xianfuyuplasma coldseepsis]
MKNIHVVIWGFGAMGKGMADMLLTKKGVEITGVCDRNPAIINTSIFSLLEEPKRNHPDVIITDDITTLLDKEICDIVLLATDSFTKNAFPKMKQVLEAGINCISTAEEMAYPKAQEPELAKELDAIAKAHNVTLLGTGINPGFIMDLLVIALSGTMKRVDHIEANRVNSLSPFGPAVMEEQGVGITLEEFHQGVDSKTLAGHVGFAESIQMIADALGVPLTRFEQQMKPIVTTVDRKSPYGEAKKGHVAGVNMTGQGYVGNDVFIDMKHPQQIEPEMEGTHTGDYITIKGVPEINMGIQPEIDGGIGTIAMCVNMIPHVLNSKPGLKTMIDLPVPRAILGDMRDLIDS